MLSRSLPLLVLVESEKGNCGSNIRAMDSFRPDVSKADISKH